MAERTFADRLDEIVARILSRGDATAALDDPELAPLARMGADLCHYPSPDWKARLRAQLERRTRVTATATATPVREGFTTVTPYIRVREAGLLDFLARVFDARETFSGRGGGGGMHREVRVGDSMVMIGEGATAGGVMPIRAVAFHVLVDDADEIFARAIAAGGTSLSEPAERPYGERAGFVADPYGNHWYIATAPGAAPVSSGRRTVTPVLHSRGAAAYVEFLKRGLGATEEMRHDEGTRLRYARLLIGDGVIELSEGEPMPGSFMLYVPDPDAKYERAMTAGATSLMPPTDQPYGRMSGVEDMAGNQWFFSRPVNQQ